jgi:hypothetical protein
LIPGSYLQRKFDLCAATIGADRLQFHYVTEPANDECSDPHTLIPPKPVDIEFVEALPDAKRIALLAILTHADFADSPNFRSQVAFI